MRWVCLLLLAPMACSRANPAFLDAAEGSSGTGGEKTTGVADGPEPTSDDSAPTQPSSNDSDPVTASDPTMTATGDSGSDDAPATDGEPCQEYLGPACDAFDSVDCPEGFKCNPHGAVGEPWGEGKCVPIDVNQGQPGDRCQVECYATSGVDNCAAGSACMHIEPETLEGTCVELCDNADDPSCGGANGCLVVNEGAFGVCSGCDPLIGGCPEGFVCLPDEFSTHCSPDGGGVGPNDVCEFTNECGEGLFCILAENFQNCAGVQCCAPLCSLAADDCQSGACLPMWEPALPGLEDIGVCVE